MYYKLVKYDIWQRCKKTDLFHSLWWTKWVCMDYTRLNLKVVSRAEDPVSLWTTRWMLWTTPSTLLLMCICSVQFWLKIIDIFCWNVVRRDRFFNKKMKKQSTRLLKWIKNGREQAPAKDIEEMIHCWLVAFDFCFIIQKLLSVSCQNRKFFFPRILSFELTSQ